MCCFSRPVKFVGATRIFARAADEGHQLLAYSMDVEIDSELAMVLPLPVPPGPPDDAVQFIDLSGYPKIFDDLAAAFPPDYSAMPQAKRAGPVVRSAPTLVVHDVGDFEASFVPTLADFARLDARFRVPERAWEARPEYADYGFAVFRLRPKKAFLGGTKRQSVHPMAFSFPRRDQGALYFPTLHIHDGTAPERANFDHALFCQTEGVLEATLDWTCSTGPLGAFVASDRARGLVDAAALGRRKGLWGPMENHDVLLRAPSGVTVADLSGEGVSYTYTARATWAYAHQTHDAMRAAWRRTATERLPALCRGLREGLAALTEARRDAWSLTALDASLPPHFMNGDVLYTGTTYMDGHAAEHRGPGKIAFRVFSERVEPQDVVLGFSALPDPSRLGVIRAELTALVDRAVAS